MSLYVIFVLLSVGDPWHFGADPDPPLWLMDPDPTPDPTPFFSDFKVAPKNCSPYFFLINYPQAHYLSLHKIFLKFCVKILFCKHYFSPLNIFLRKGKDPDPYLWLMDPDPGGPKTCGFSRSPTLVPWLLHNRISSLISGSATLTEWEKYFALDKFSCSFILRPKFRQLGNGDLDFAGIVSQ